MNDLLVQSHITIRYPVALFLLELSEKKTTECSFEISWTSKGSRVFKDTAGINQVNEGKGNDVFVILLERRSEGCYF